MALATACVVAVQSSFSRLQCPKQLRVRSASIEAGVASAMEGSILFCHPVTTSPFAVYHRLEPRFGDVSWIVLISLSDLRVLQAGAVEELGFRRARHQARYSDAAIFKFIA